MSSIPPNNLDQVVAWLRVFIQESNDTFAVLKRDLKKLSKKVEESENE